MSGARRSLAARPKVDSPLAPNRTHQKPHFGWRSRKRGISVNLLDNSPPIDVALYSLLAAATVASTSLFSTAEAIEIISNFPSNDMVASDLDSSFSKAVGFTMPSGVPYILDSASVSLLIDTLGAETAWSFALFADASGNPDLSVRW